MPTIALRNLLLLCWIGFLSSEAGAFTANKVWMEFRPNGRFRVYVNYTVPALREFRESYGDFAKKTEAEKFYFDLLRGADFHMPNAKDREFVNPPAKPDPW